MRWIFHHAVTLALGAAIALGIGVFLGALQTKSSCPPKEPTAWHIEGKEYSGWYQGYPKNSQFSATQEKSSQTTDYSPYDSYKKILETWFCEDAKLTDLTIAIFTYFLVVIGGLTVWQVDRTAKKTERAYIFGGGPYRIGWLNSLDLPTTGMCSLAVSTTETFLERSTTALLSCI
jgi:hypothetical protein